MAKNKHGGKRAGAGRPKGSKNKKKTTSKNSGISISRVTAKNSSISIGRVKI